MWLARRGGTVLSKTPQMYSEISPRLMGSEKIFRKNLLKGMQTLHFFHIFQVLSLGQTGSLENPSSGSSLPTAQHRLTGNKDILYGP